MNTVDQEDVAFAFRPLPALARSCTAIWRFNWSGRGKRLPQPGYAHANGLSPVSGDQWCPDNYDFRTSAAQDLRVRMCLVRFEASTKPLNSQHMSLIYMVIRSDSLAAVRAHEGLLSIVCALTSG